MMSPDPMAEALEFAKTIFEGDSGGHDFHHTLRVRRTALYLCSAEGGDPFLVEAAAILHDVDDVKLTGRYMLSPGSEPLPNARRFMTGQGFPPEKIEAVAEIISTVSFRGTGTRVPSTLEGKIVQDADRLDAVGPVGIARCFAYGGSRGRMIFDPEERPAEIMSAEEYYTQKKSSAAHFYEKLFKLKDLMNTAAAKRIAEERHRFMERFLDAFYHQWFFPEEPPRR